ncbi:MAG: hypothetical protein E7353_03820 [Clostridiales bacterium]|nr:hypothetical protein [Clostridiales bacterium]
MKRFKSLFLSLILVLALLVGVVACDNGGDGGKDTPDPVTYTLSFEMNGHGTQTPDQVLEEDEVTVQPTNPTESGWNFEGWYTDNNFSQLYTFGSTLSSDTTVYAKWEQEVVVNKHTVTFVTGVSDCVINAQDVAEGGKVTLPKASDMVSAGKKFEGWYLDAGYAVSFDANTIVTQGFSIYAKWSTYFKVTFDRNGRGSANRTPQPQEYFVEGSKAEKPDDMSANSYKFLGWSVDKNGKDNLYDFDAELTDSITLFAQWLRLYRVSFDLNNDEALQLPPEDQNIEEGKLAVRPETDPVVIGYRFDGWYTEAEGGELFDFNTTVINETTTIYAHWTKTQVETLDVETPEYTYREEAPYGERPDLDGYVINGKMGAEEKWEEQDWFVSGITEAPTVTYKISTQFSEKGLYVFIQVEDNGGLYHDGRNYYFKNSHLEFRINASTYRTNWFRIDTETLYPSSQRVKIAVNIAEGEVNTANADNKRAVMNVELFATWKDLQFYEIPESVGIYTMYKYKRIAADNIKYTLSSPFDDLATIDPLEFVQYGPSGYLNADAENATVGHSSLNIAKTPGWDISHESAEENAYVSSNGFVTQAIFYKGIVDTEYYEYSFEIDGSKYINGGKAGGVIYSSEINYAMLLFTVNGTTYDKNTNKFKIAQPYIRVTDKDGKLKNKTLDPIDVSETGRIQVKIVFSSGHVYCIVNEVLIHCEFVANLNVRTNPGLCTTEGGEGIRFINYTARVLTAKEAKEVTAQYAYVLTIGRLKNLTIELNTTGVSSKEGVSKKVVMDVQNSSVALTNSQKNKILEDGEIDSRIIINQIESLIFTVDGVAHDITEDLIDAETGAKWGEFVYEYPFTGDAVITNTSSVVPTEELTAIVGTLIDNDTGKPVAATATITSNNPRLSKYDMGIVGGVIVLIVPKGYDYKISFNQTAYRTTTLDVIENIDGIYTIEDPVKLVPNVLGGTALSRKSSMAYGSSIAGWDMSRESDGIIIFETTKANPPPVYFSGYTIHEYQYAKVSVTNITDPEAHAVYEKDPGIGFRIENGRRTVHMLLRQKGTRYLDGSGGWNPVHNTAYGSPTCDFIDITGEHKDTLEILRINRALYTWINGFYMGCTILPEELEGEAAISVAGTFSYYGKIIYRDYEIKVGDDAIAIAKERMEVPISMDDTIYGFDEEWNTDYNQPLIKVEGLTEIEYDNGVTEEIALAGNNITITRTEFAADDELYTVSVGSYASAIISAQNPTATIKIPDTAKGQINISMVRESSAVVSGKFVPNGFTLENPIEGYLLFNDGLSLSFTTGLDGTFAISVPTSQTFTLKLSTSGYITPELNTRSPNNAGQEKKLGDLALYTTVFGGVIAGTSYNSSLPYGEFSTGYDVSDDTPWEGEYLDVTATFSNQYVSINTGRYTNFEASFSLIRHYYADRPNESDPAFGLEILCNGGSDQILFHKNGVRSFPKGKDRVQEYDLMKYNTASSYGIRVDFRIIRRQNLYFMYYKLENDPAWIMIKRIESTLSGPAALRFESCTSKALHFTVWNFNVKALNSTNIPDDLISNINVNVSSGENTGSATLGGGTEIAGEIKHVVGDVATVTLKANNGYMPAYAKVDGEFVSIVSNKIQFIVNSTNINVEVVFEPVFETYTVTGKIAVDKTYKDFVLPKYVTIVAYMVDGRTYSSNVAVGTDGSVSMKLRAGTFKMYAYSDTLASREVDVTISSINKNFGTLTLSTMIDGATTVNGVTLVNSKPMDKELLYKEGMLNLPFHYTDACWLPEAVTANDFVFSTDIIQSGNPESPYYSNDEVAGLIFSNGTKTFSMKFWGDGLRISEIGYSTAGMLWPHINKDVAYFGSMNASTVKTVNFAVKLVGTDMLVYINQKHIFTMTTSKGFVWASGVTGTEHYPNNNDVVKEAYAAVVGDGTKEIAIGFHCNLGTAAERTNQAGFYNVKFTDKASLVSSFNGKF